MQQEVEACGAGDGGSALAPDAKCNDPEMVDRREALRPVECGRTGFSIERGQGSYEERQSRPTELNKLLMRSCLAVARSVRIAGSGLASIYLWFAPWDCHQRVLSPGFLTQRQPNRKGRKTSRPCFGKVIASLCDNLWSITAQVATLPSGSPNGYACRSGACR